MAKFQVYESRDGQYRWRLVAANGEIVATSEGYVSRSNAKRSAQRVQEIAPIAQIMEL